MSFALLSLLCLVALVGPWLAVRSRAHPPVVVGELLVGLALGATGLRTLDPADPTFAFLAEVGFALIMFTAGTHVPLRQPSLRTGLRVGALRAGVVAATAAALGVAIATAFGTGHGALYGVLLASSSAGLVLPALAGTDLGQGPLAELVPQVALADAAAIVALPLALDPPRALHATLGAFGILGLGVALWRGLAALERSGLRRAVHRVSEDNELAVELRFLLAALFGLCAVALALGVSVMLAGFTLGLAVAAVGEPRRVAKQVFALTEGLFGPLFFVWLGASLDLRDLGTHPAGIGLGLTLGAGALAAHLAPALRGQRAAAAALTAAQLGVPVAAVTLGTQRGVLLAGEGPALLLGALVSIAAVALLAPRVAASAQPAH